MDYLSSGSLPAPFQFQGSAQTNAALSQSDLDMLQEFLWSQQTAHVTAQGNVNYLKLPTRIANSASHVIDNLSPVSSEEAAFDPSVASSTEQVSPRSPQSSPQDSQWICSSEQSFGSSASSASLSNSLFIKEGVNQISPRFIDQAHSVADQSPQPSPTGSSKAQISPQPSLPSSDVSISSSPDGTEAVATEWLDNTTTSSRPNESYMMLIAHALLSVPDHQMLLVDIYRHIEKNHPYFITAKSCWRNSVRHNLSVNECFVRGKRAPNGRGFYWGIHPACIESFLRGDFTRRVVRGKAQTHTREATSPDSPSAQGLSQSTQSPKSTAVSQSVTTARKRSSDDYEPMSSTPVNAVILASVPAKPSKQYRKQNYATIQAQCALLLGYNAYSHYIA